MKTIIIACALAAAALGQNLTLTPAGISNGFTLTTFATINPGLNNNTGVYGVAVGASGNVLVNNYLNNTRYVFPDVDGQTPASAIASTTSNSFSTANATAFGLAYGGVNSQFVQFNANGTVNHALTGISQTPYFGMWGNPVNGHIVATTGQGQIIDINPLANGGTGSATVIASPGLVYDGVAISPDGLTAYVEQNNHIIGYTISNGAQVFDSGALFGFPDGVGVISSSNALNGKLIVNFNGVGLNAGFVGLLDPVTHAVTTIASGGTRGDYAAPDPSNGSLFVVYSDIVYRLSCGAGCSIGQAPSTPGAPPATPIPSTLFLAILGIICAGLYAQRRKPSGWRIR